MYHTRHTLQQLHIRWPRLPERLHRIVGGQNVGSPRPASLLPQIFLLVEHGGSLNVATLTAYATLEALRIGVIARLFPRIHQAVIRYVLNKLWLVICGERWHHEDRAACVVQIHYILL